MKLFEKVKNMFTEEVEEEVKVEQISMKQKKDNTPEVIASFDDVKIEKDEPKKPVFFTDHDFDDMKQEQKSRSERDLQTKVDYDTRSSYHNNFNDYRTDNNVKRDIYRGNQTNIYNDPYKEKKEERVFKPTPIISPVYGILDKNYHKEDIVSKKETSYSVNESSNSIDSVRKKAYGTLEDELENTLFGSNSILFNKKDEQDDKNDGFFDELENEVKPDLLNNYGDDYLDSQDKKIQDLEEITMDIGKELNSLLTKKDSNKKEDKDEDDLFDLIDTMYEGDE